MTEPTMVTSNSIQNRRVTESVKSVNIDKAFSYYINGLKEADSRNGSLPQVENENNREFIIIDGRLTTLNDVQFSENENFYTLTQRWRGTVLKVSSDEFSAKLEDLNDGGTNEYAEFYFNEISKDDKPLVSKGAVFYWSLGYANDKGSIKKESLIRFQRLPEWSTEEVDSAIDKARIQAKVLQWV
jgi:hypothetical protein